MKKIFFGIVIIVLFAAIGRNLLPLTHTMFTFHDMSQAGRIDEFTLNIKNLHIPPRLAPRWSEGMGYPVFNFYAPFAYWVSSLINLLGFSTVDALKISFFAALIIAFIGMFLFLRSAFNSLGALVGASLYAASPYVATEIFVRGNLGEMWFMALLPLCFYLYNLNSQNNKKNIFVFTCISTFFLLTSHNIFSLIGSGLLFVHILLLNNKKKNFISLVLALLLSSYFILPALFETSLTYARETITQTFYGDHFLCITQIWTSPWGYGGSAKGCVEDGMSFMIGKFHILAGMAGLTLLIFQLCTTKRKDNKIMLTILFVFALGLISTFLTLYQSEVVWKNLSFVLALFQFPWRFLMFTNFALSFFAGYFFSTTIFKKKYAYVVPIIFILICLLNYSKYFKGQTFDINLYNEKYLSNEYISKEIAYTIPDYLPKTVNLKEWLRLQPVSLTNDINKSSNNSQKSLTGIPLDNGYISIRQNNLFSKELITNSSDLLLNLHYFPYWHIYINGKEYFPKNFDILGRPVITGSGVKKILIIYHQTPVEIAGNIITLLACITLFVIALPKKRKSVSHSESSLE